MGKYCFNVENVDVIDETDVLVVGSGPAGVCSAISASRSGVKTLLVEKYGFLGGCLSAVNVQSYGFSINQDHEVLSGLPLELEQRAVEHGVTQKDYRGSGFFVSSEKYKCFLDEWLISEGVKILLYCTVCGAYLEGNTIKGVYVVTKNGVGIILAKRVIDATGDGDVAFYSGAEYFKREKNEMQPVTVIFGIGGVDLELFRLHNRLHVDKQDPDYGFRPIFRKATENGEWGSIKRNGAFKTVNEDGSIESLNIIACFNTDATDVFDVTGAEIEGRKQAKTAVELFRKYGKEMGLSNCYLRNISVQLGVRETRRIVGEHVLTEQDIVNDTERDNGIGRFLVFIDKYGKFVYEKGKTFSIPFGVILPKKIENLTVAGRCVSCDEDAFGCIRLMPCCALTGEACGVVSALSLQKGVSPREISVKELKSELLKRGVAL